MLAIDPSAQISLSRKPIWRHLDEQAVFAGIEALIKAPDSLSQGALGLCGEAAFIRHVIKTNADGFVAMAKQLFTDSYGFLGDLVIRPDFIKNDLRKADYPAIVQARLEELKKDPRLAPIPPPADWMVLSALRNSENRFLDFEGTPHESLAEGSHFHELFGWYRRSKLYTKVVLDENRDVTHVGSSVVKTDRNRIALRINVRMIAPPPSAGTHVIALESPFTITSNAVTFQYWTWGRPVDTANLTLKEFTDTYLGAITAEF